MTVIYIYALALTLILISVSASVVIFGWSKVLKFKEHLEYIEIILNNVISKSIDLERRLNQHDSSLYMIESRTEKIKTEELPFIENNKKGKS